jgi:hypothetical protein
MGVCAGSGGQKTVPRQCPGPFSTVPMRSATCSVLQGSSPRPGPRRAGRPNDGFQAAYVPPTAWACRQPALRRAGKKRPQLLRGGVFRLLRFGMLAESAALVACLVATNILFVALAGSRRKKDALYHRPLKVRADDATLSVGVRRRLVRCYLTRIHCGCQLAGGSTGSRGETLDAA